MLHSSGCFPFVRPRISEIVFGKQFIRFFWSPATEPTITKKTNNKTFPHTKKPATYTYGIGLILSFSILCNIGVNILHASRNSSDRTKCI